MAVEIEGDIPIMRIKTNYTSVSGGCGAKSNQLMLSKSAVCDIYRKRLFQTSDRIVLWKVNFYVKAAAIKTEMAVMMNDHVLMDPVEPLRWQGSVMCRVLDKSQ